APGKPLFTLVKDEPLKIELSVPEKAVAAVKIGEQVQLATVAFPDKVYSASVTRVGAEIGRTRSLIVEATIDKGSDLVPGMFAEAHLVIGQTPRVILPKDAVAHRGKQWHAFVVKNGEVEDHIVQLGVVPPAPDRVAIVQGVEKGDKVVGKVTDAVVDG